MTRLRSALVVDCNELNIELVCVLLADAGIEARSVGDADGMARAIADHRPDVVLLEMRLPDVDAVELVARLRADPALSELPIVAVTACAMRGDRERFLAAGCDGYIPKPVDTAGFVAEIESIVATARSAS